MLEPGRLCVKVAGRDAGKKCVVVDVVDKSRVLIDGETRRRKCNITHLEPLEKTIKIKKGASHSEVAGEFKKLGLQARETKPKKAGEKPKKQGRKEKKTGESQTGKETSIGKKPESATKQKPEKQESKKTAGQGAQKK